MSLNTAPTQRIWMAFNGPTMLLEALLYENTHRPLNTLASTWFLRCLMVRGLVEAIKIAQPKKKQYINKSYAKRVYDQRIDIRVVNWGQVSKIVF